MPCSHTLLKKTEISVNGNRTLSKKNQEGVLIINMIRSDLPSAESVYLPVCKMDLKRKVGGKDSRTDVEVVCRTDNNLEYV